MPGRAGPPPGRPARIPRPRAPGRPRADDRTPFEEIEPIENAVPMDAWGGWKGEGLGAALSLYVATGSRGGDPSDGGGPSKIYRFDAGSELFVDDEPPEGAETISKMRNTADTLYAFFESPGDGQTWMLAKPLEHEGAGGWDFEDVPSHGSPVGGRGLAIDGPEGEAVFGGASQDWNAGGASAEVYVKEGGGGWDEHRVIEPSLIWELEFDIAEEDGEGRLWEFFSDFDREHTVALFVDGEEKTYPPGNCIACACWFKGHMYVIGNLVNPEEANKIYRSESGDEWEEVHTLDEAVRGDHVKFIPRGEEGELWYTGHNPFEAGYSFDGEEWTREESLPSFATSDDTNQRTAIAYYGPDDDELDRGVWIFARDAEADTARVFRDRGAGALMLQVI